MDIALIQEEIAQDLEIVDVPIYKKNGDPYTGPDGQQCTIGVQGTDAPDVKAAKAVIQRRFLRTTRLDEHDVARNRVDSAASAVKRWSGWVAAGAEFQCTPENVKALLGADHILEQVEAGIRGHADFFKRSSTT